MNYAALKNERAVWLSSFSAFSLRRVTENDPTLKILRIGCLSIPQTHHMFETGNMVGYGDSNTLGILFAAGDPESVSKLGNGLGKNSHLEELTIRGSRGLKFTSFSPIDQDPFCEGFKMNSSIVRLTLKSASGPEIARVIGGNAGSNLKYLTLLNCHFGDILRHDRALLLALQECTHLKSISIQHCDLNLGGEFSRDFFSAIRGNRHLENLELIYNNIGVMGWEALAALLEDPGCNIRHMDLRGNVIQDIQSEIAIAHALRRHKSVESIYFGRYRGTFETDLRNLLDNTSSINATFSSNHTLHHVRNDRGMSWRSPYLELNADANKKNVAMKKILKSHTHFDAKPLFKWEERVLPSVAGWFGRARACADGNIPLLDNAKSLEFSAMYQFLRAFPRMLKPTNKRKRSEIESDRYHALHEDFQLGYQKPDLAPDPPQWGHLLSVGDKNMFMNIVKSLMSHADGWVFIHPVDPTELRLPEYFDIIDKPMDLVTVQKRLENGWYHSTEDVEKDFNLIFDNAMLFNVGGDPLNYIAKKLKDYFARRLLCSRHPGSTTRGFCH